MIEVLFFKAPWCSACGGVLPHISAVCKDLSVKMETVDVSTFDGETTGMRYNICSLPTVVVLSNGEMIGRIDSGVTRQGVIDLIKQAKDD